MAVQVPLPEQVCMNEEWEVLVHRLVETPEIREVEWVESEVIREPEMIEW